MQNLKGEKEVQKQSCIWIIWCNIFSDFNIHYSSITILPSCFILLSCEFMYFKIKQSIFCSRPFGCRRRAILVGLLPVATPVLLFNGVTKKKRNAPSRTRLSWWNYTTHTYTSIHCNVLNVKKNPGCQHEFFSIVYQINSILVNKIIRSTQEKSRMAPLSYFYVLF